MLKNIFVIFLIAFSSCVSQQSDTGKLPIIYNEEYNISIIGLENFHPFDTKKYEKVYEHLTETFSLNEDDFYIPEMVSNESLLLVHTAEYLESLNESSVIADIAELSPLEYLPNSLLQSSILEPMKYAVQGTITGAELALEKGWAINLSGGYHHAKSDEGSGFCFFADINIAVEKLWQKDSTLKVLVVDLDAHQGNGHEATFKDDDRVFIFDIYNEDIYPQDYEAARYIDYNNPVPYGTGCNEYMNLLKEKLPQAIKECLPDLIIYNAGTDIFEEDELGGFEVSAKGIVERDGFVFRQALDSKIPVLMVLSGGYSPKSGTIIGVSIENILKNVLKLNLKAGND